MQHRFGPIHIKGGEAWVQGEQDKSFPDLPTLLRKLGCEVTPLEPEVIKTNGWVVPLAMYNVVFPEGAKIIKHPRDRVSRTASGRRRRGVKNEPDLSYSGERRKGMVLIPGVDTDFVVTWRRKDGESPESISKTVQEVEKD